MSDLLRLHLFHPKQWKEAEEGHLLFDREISNWSTSACSPESICPPILEFFTESLSVQILFAIFVGFWVWNSSKHLGKTKQGLMLLFLGLVVVLGDFFSNQLKYIFSRMRPDHELRFLEEGIKPAYSFPSNHAFNLFALAAVLWLLSYRGNIKGVKIPIVMSLIAILVSLSRVFAGRHFPLDIIGGLLFGASYAFLSLKIASCFVTKIRASYKAR